MSHEDGDHEDRSAADGSDGTAGDHLETGAEAATEAATSGVDRCDFCRLPRTGDTVTLERDGITYQFCCASCRDALDGSDRVFTQYHGFRRMRTGVTALDRSLPQGMPRNSFVLLNDLAGSRTEALQAELVWRALQRDEPAVILSFLEPPVSLVQEFVGLEWNVLPALESGQLRIVDGFSYRVEDRERMYERLDPWNAHVWSIAEEATETVRDPTDMSELQNRLDSALEELGMQDEGIVVIDSLTELGSLVQPVQSYSFLKDIRADVCKGRFVPIFAGATITGDGEGFPHDLGYMVDGIIEMRLNEELIEDALVKQLRVRKMSSVLTYPEWHAYEFAAGKGIVTFDPRAQQAAAEDEAAGADDEAAGEATDDETDPAEAPDDETEPSDAADEDQRTESSDAG